MAAFVVTFEGESYDIKDFVQKHPGGTGVFDEYRKGGDITNAFNEVGHSSDAVKLLQKYKLQQQRQEQPQQQQQRELTASERNILREQNNKEIERLYGVKFTTRKLFTNEDKYFVHKFLGLSTLLSFAYRYFYVWPTTGTLGMTGSTFDYITLAIHTLLSVSSLIFHVLEKRIVQNPLIIYEEYRQHAIVFTLRTVFVALFGFHVHKVSYPVAAVILLVLMTIIHLWVDDITAKHGTTGVTAVRNTNDGSLKPVRMAFSFYQFLVIACSLIPSPAESLSDIGFNAIVAIQSSSFLMTLKRKSLIRWHTYIFWYSLALFLSTAFMVSVHGPMILAVTAVCFFLRTKLSISKYHLWGGYWLICNAINIYANK